MRYCGHRYRADYEKVMDEPGYDKKVKEKSDRLLASTMILSVLFVTLRQIGAVPRTTT